MEMKNKLHFKRINWWLYLVERPSLYSEFMYYKHCHRKLDKIRSNNRKAYYFLLSRNGRKWIKEMREFYNSKHRFLTDEEVIRIVKTPWIKLSEED